MIMRRFSVVQGIAVMCAAILGFGALAAPTPASAAVPSSIEFLGPSSITAEFGSPWSFTLAVKTYYDRPEGMRAGPTDGTVDIFLSGVGDAFATDLPIQADGLVYFAQPLSKPLLAAGTYEVSAIYSPAPGSYLDSSQTGVMPTLEITPLTVVPAVEASNDPAIAKHPVITASLGGPYTKSQNGSPAGTWTFRVSETAEGAEVFSTDVPQQHGDAEPIRVEVVATLTSGTDYTVTAEFAPSGELAGGIDVAPVPTASFSTPGTTLIDSLTTRLPFPGWLVLAIGILVLALVVTVIVLGVRISKLPARKPAAQRLPGEPMDVEELSWDEAGISQRPPTAPSSTNWTLSDDGDLTERLDIPPTSKDDSL